MIPGQTPFTLWFGFKPSLEHFRVFGCQVYAYVEKQHRTKLDPKSHLCYFLGYCDHTKGYRIWDPETSHVLVRREVTFNEQLLYGDTVTPSSASEDSPSNTVSLSYPITDVSSSFSLPSSSSSSSASDQRPLSPDGSLSLSAPSNFVTSSAEIDRRSPPSSPTLLSHPNYRLHTPVNMRSLADIAPPPPVSIASDPSHPLAHAQHVYSSSTSSLATAALSSPNSSSDPSSSLPSSPQITADYSPDDPYTYLEALQSSDAAQWIHAMTEEIHSLKENKTWELVRLPDGRQAIQCKWVFKTKYLPNGNIDKFKARLVAKGYTQKVGIDYSETFSPVVKFETVRIVMAITAADDLEIVQFDIKTAFLNGDIAEQLYMEQLEGFVDLTHPDYVCLLLKALYGRKQASRNWNDTFHKFLLQFGFQVSDADPCAYYSSQGGQTIILLIYVDDGLICFSKGTNVDHILDSMDKAFSNTRGPAGCYVGLRITRRRETHEIFLDQTHYLTKLVRRFGFHDSIPLSVPADPHTTLSLLSFETLPLLPLFLIRRSLGVFNLLALVHCPTFPMQ